MTTLLSGLMDGISCKYECLCSYNYLFLLLKYFFCQASKQLDASIWTLMKQGMPDVLGLEDWLNKVSFS